MILNIEIEKFIHDIEKRLPNLEGTALQNAQDKIALLNRINLEFMDYEELLRKVALQNNQIKGENMKREIQMRDMQSKIDTLVQEIKHLKSNIE